MIDSHAISIVGEWIGKQKLNAIAQTHPTITKRLIISIIFNMLTIQQLIQNNTIDSFYALVYAPNRKRNRNRFPENCVFKMDSEEETKTAAKPEKNLYPALICGPSRSSEGLMLYYLIQWLD